MLLVPEISHSSHTGSASPRDILQTTLASATQHQASAQPPGLPMVSAHSKYNFKWPAKAFPAQLALGTPWFTCVPSKTGSQCGLPSGLSTAHAHPSCSFRPQVNLLLGIPLAHTQSSYNLSPGSPLESCPPVALWPTPAPAPAALPRNSAHTMYEGKAPTRGHSFRNRGGFCFT